MFDDLSEYKKIPPLIRECWNRLNCVFMERVKKVGLTPDQYSVLRWTFSSYDKSLTQSELAVLMATDCNNISSLVRRMEAMGLIERNVSFGDHRKKNILLTKTGLLKFNKAKVIANRLEEELLLEIPPIERDAFLKILRKLSRSILDE